jgi:type IV pilus assembly protein PilY1
MLHGFNALTGNEVLGYVPNEVFSNLNQLPSTAYSHLYFVDGSPNSSDVTFADTSWHTVLATTMGVGGKGIFVLDVTDPSQFTEANAASIVKFEFTDANNSDIGYIQGQPQIVKLNTGKWAAVFGNGYNNTGTGNAALFIVDIETGALIQEISTKTGSSTTPNGLSTPTLIDVDGNGTADFAYAGDLYGNVWKFDLTSTNPSNWKLAINGGKPLFAAQTGQQITEQPEVTASPYGGYMVIFGTGQYLQTTDISNTTTQTLYGIWDNNNTVTVPLKNLQQQTATQVTPTYRSVTDILVNYPTQQGWYVNMPLSGERSVTSPLLTGGVVYFTTLVPNTAVCTYGGTSWLMAIDFLNGGQLSYPIMDTNGDGVVNSKDTPYGGVNLFSISSSPTLLQGLGNQNTPLQELFFNLSSGNVTGLYTAGSQNTSRRTSWKTILQQ